MAHNNYLYEACPSPHFNMALPNFPPLNQQEQALGYYHENYEQMPDNIDYNNQSFADCHTTMNTVNLFKKPLTSQTAVTKWVKHNRLDGVPLFQDFDRCVTQFIHSGGFEGISQKFLQWNDRQLNQQEVCKHIAVEIWPCLQNQIIANGIFQDRTNYNTLHDISKWILHFLSGELPYLLRMKLKRLDKWPKYSIPPLSSIVTEPLLQVYQQQCPKSIAGDTVVSTTPVTPLGTKINSSGAKSVTEEQLLTKFWDVIWRETAVFGVFLQELHFILAVDIRSVIITFGKEVGADVNKLDRIILDHTVKFFGSFMVQICKHITFAYMTSPNRHLMAPIHWVDNWIQWESSMSYILRTVNDLHHQKMGHTSPKLCPFKKVSWNPQPLFFNKQCLLDRLTTECKALGLHTPSVAPVMEFKDTQDYTMNEPEPVEPTYRPTKSPSYYQRKPSQPYPRYYRQHQHNSTNNWWYSHSPSPRHEYSSKHTHAPQHTYLPSHTHSPSRTHSQECRHSHVSTYSPRRTHSHMYSSRHIQSQEHTHSQKYTHSQEHTHSPKRTCSSSPKRTYSSQHTHSPRHSPEHLSSCKDSHAPMCSSSNQSPHLISSQHSQSTQQHVATGSCQNDSQLPQHDMCCPVSYTPRRLQPQCKCMPRKSEAPKNIAAPSTTATHQSVQSTKKEIYQQLAARIKPYCKPV